MHGYRAMGLSIRSEIALPGLIGMNDPVADFDVEIHRCTVVDGHLENPIAIAATWQMSAEQFLFRVPGIARFLLTCGRDIAVEIDYGVPDEEVAIFLIGTVLGILMHQRGGVVLHASAVQVGDKAVLFCGSSGSGKSTIAAALNLRGYPLIADDVCVIEFGAHGTPCVRSDGRLLKLWHNATEQLRLTERRGSPVRRRLNKFYVEPRDTVLGDAIPLGALYALRESRAPFVDGIETLNAVEAMTMTRRYAYRPSLVGKMGQRTRYFHAAASIASAARSFYLTRALTFQAMAGTIGVLERHWESIFPAEVAFA